MPSNAYMFPEVETANRDQAKRRGLFPEGRSRRPVATIPQWCLYRASAQVPIPFTLVEETMA